MIFYVVVNAKVRDITLTKDVLSSGQSFYSKINADMDKGWQMGREWVEQPTIDDRCKIVADRARSAMMCGKETLAKLLAGYIIDQMPGVIAVNLDTSGEMEDTEFLSEEGWNKKTRRANPQEVKQQAGKEVAAVHKVGRNYRFATYDRMTEQWIESALFDSEDQAEVRRLQAVELRISELANTIFWLGN